MSGVQIFMLLSLSAQFTPFSWLNSFTMFVEEVEKALVFPRLFKLIHSRKKNDCTVIWNGLCSVHKPPERLTLHIIEA